MALGTITDTNLTAVANAIRNKAGIATTMTITEMPNLINNISTWPIEEVLNVSSDSYGTSTVVANPILSDFAVNEIRIIYIKWWQKYYVNSPSIAYVYAPSTGSYTVRTFGSNTSTTVSSGGTIISKSGITTASGYSRQWLDADVIIVTRTV